MLFRKKKEKCCGLCLHAAILDEDTVMCRKKGERNFEDKCLSFVYDPCKRVPMKARALDTDKYESYDYSL